MADMKVKLHPFGVPNYVRPMIPGKESNSEGTAIPIADVPRDTILKMCEDFKKSVLKMNGYEGG